MSATQQFNTRDGAKIGRSFHEQVAQVNERHSGYDEVIFAMCFGPLIDGMRSEKAKLWMQCALAAECEALRGETIQKAA
ncbi:MAG: hypothetical protein B7Z77_08520 [Acidocella sp. 20-58-15]|nr:MAG: hypothetical protein B7Z77_08520 [Acidocella sp. 20-58-15]